MGKKQQHEGGRPSCTKVAFAKSCRNLLQNDHCQPQACRNILLLQRAIAIKRLPSIMKVLLLSANSLFVAGCREQTIMMFTVKQSNAVCLCVYYLNKGHATDLVDYSTIIHNCMCWWLRCGYTSSLMVRNRCWVRQLSNPSSETKNMVTESQLNNIPAD